MKEQERMYMEDVDEQKARRGYRTAELDSLQRHEVERGSDLQHQAYGQRYVRETEVQSLVSSGFNLV